MSHCGIPFTRIVSTTQALIIACCTMKMIASIKISII
jgi:hypothetical protein